MSTGLSHLFTRIFPSSCDIRRIRSKNISVSPFYAFRFKVCVNVYRKFNCADTKIRWWREYNSNVRWKWSLNRKKQNLKIWRTKKMLAYRFLFQFSKFYFFFVHFFSIYQSKIGTRLRCISLDFFFVWFVYIIKWIVGRKIKKKYLKVFSNFTNVQLGFF